MYDIINLWMSINPRMSSHKWFFSANNFSPSTNHQIFIQNRILSLYLSNDIIIHSRIHYTSYYVISINFPLLYSNKFCFVISILKKNSILPLSLTLFSPMLQVIIIFFAFVAFLYTYKVLIKPYLLIQYYRKQGLDMKFTPLVGSFK